MVPCEFSLPGFHFRVISLEQSKTYFGLLIFDREIRRRKEFTGGNYKKSRLKKVSKFNYPVNNFEDRNEICVAYKKSIEKFISINEKNFFKSCCSLDKVKELKNRIRFETRLSRASEVLKRVNELPDPSMRKKIFKQQSGGVLKDF